MDQVTTPNQLSTQSEPQISVHLVSGQDHSITADVQIENLQEPSLGAAFHLDYDEKILEYLDYEKGDFFEQNKEDPIYLIKDVQGKIYAGISLRRDQQMVEKSGTLVKLHFKPLQDGKIDFIFENGLLTTLDSGHRKNLSAGWQNEKFTVNNVLQPAGDTSLLITLGIVLICIFLFSGFFMFATKFRATQAPNSGQQRKNLQK